VDATAAVCRVHRNVGAVGVLSKLHSIPYEEVDA